MDPFAFFAVKVRAVRIGDAPAPVAPLFEVMERPNDWDRRVKGAVETGRAFSKSGYTLEDSQRFNANPLGTSG